ncbi:hypothetical protein STEG23_003197, partial [Scotinomys teguina]
QNKLLNPINVCENAVCHEYLGDEGVEICSDSKQARTQKKLQFQDIQSNVARYLNVGVLCFAEAFKVYEIPFVNCGILVTAFVSLIFYSCFVAPAFRVTDPVT